MSDLDADLYGDLYGDDNEFAVPTEEPKDTKPQEQQPEKTNPAVAPSAPTAPEAPAKAEIAPPQERKEEQHPIPSLANGNANAPQPIQSYSSSDQNYSARPDYGYRTTPQIDMSQAAATITPLQVVDRHVRPSEMKDEGKMFIGGLNWDTTDEGLKKYFEQFGKVEACTIMRDATGRSRCFAFLTFEEPASVNAVMVREHVLDGKIIDPKRAIPRQEHQRAQKLFIGGLAGTVTSESMREYFSQYGKVIDSTVMLDRETGRSKGFGFVSFENTNVEPILGFGKLEIDGKMIDVKLAQPRHQRDGNGVEGGNYRSGGGGYGAQSDSAAYGSANTSGGYNSSGAVGTPPGGGQVASGNTPFDPQALAQLYTRMFQQFGGASGMGNMGGMGMMGAGGMGMGMGGAAGAGPAGIGRLGMGGAGTGMMAMGAAPMAPMGGRSGMAGGMMGGGGPMNAPRGPRGGSGGPQGGLGPQRSQRQHGYHPYSR